MIKALSILAALAATPFAMAQSLTLAPSIAGTRLDISARGEVSRTPDIALISAGVVTQARDAKSALAANATRMSRVVAALRATGIAERDITTAQISLSPQYRYAQNLPPVITGYQATNTVRIRFREIARSGAVLDTLVAEGANQIDGPNLMLDKPEGALDEARTAAIATARARAELYSSATGLRVKRIVSISESADSFAPPPVMVTAMRAQAADAKTEIVPGEQQVGVTVAVTFELN